MRRQFNLTIFSTRSLHQVLLFAIILIGIVLGIWIFLTTLSVMTMLWMHAHAPVTTIVLISLPFIALALGLYVGVILLNRWFC